MILPVNASLTLTFLALALLAALVATISARRRGLDEEAALRFGALLFLGQFAVFLLGKALAMPSPLAHGMALALGGLGTLKQGGAERP